MLWLQSFAFLTVALFPLLSKSARQAIRNKSLSSRMFFLSFLLMIFLGQISNSSRIFFPFVRWDMYTHEPSDSIIYKYYLSSGNERIEINWLEISPIKTLDQLQSYLDFEVRKFVYLNGVNESDLIRKLEQLRQSYSFYHQSDYSHYSIEVVSIDFVNDSYSIVTKVD